MDITPVKAQDFIQECWGKDLLSLDYAALRELSGDVVRPLIKELSIEMPLIAWTRKVMPALTLLTERVLTCKGCGELGIRLVGASWQVLPEGQCPFCKKDILVRPEVEQAPLNWITGQPLEPGLEEVSVDGVMIPLTADGVRPAIAILFGEEHDIDDQFAPYPVLHVLNVLLNKGFQQIRSPREALRALVFPMQFDLLLPDVQRLIDHIQRGEWLMGQVSSPRSRSTPVDSSAVGSELNGGGFDKLVAVALRQFPYNKVLANWVNSPERPAAISARRVVPRILRDEMANLYTSWTSARQLLDTAGYAPGHIPSMDVPSEFWYSVFEAIAQGII